MSHPDYPNYWRYCLCGCGAHLGNHSGQRRYLFESCRTRHKDIVARAKGGDRLWSNLTAACQICNSSKGADSLLDYLLRSREPVPWWAS